MCKAIYCIASLHSPFCLRLNLFAVMSYRRSVESGPQPSKFCVFGSNELKNCSVVDKCACAPKTFGINVNHFGE